MGEGRNGSVYLAEHKTLQVLRAIKIVPKNREDYQSYYSETMLLKQIRHPGIPLIYDLEEDSQALYIIEEYMEGQTLYQRVADMGAMSFLELVDFGISLCIPIGYLHGISILHLDIHPGNLILHEKGVSLIDFDHAKTMEELSEGFGARGFAAPEQYRGRTATKQTDLYGMGAILYFAGTGTFPKEGEMDMPKNWGREFSNLILAMLSPNPQDRPGSAEEVKQTLEGIKENRLPSFRIGLAGASRGCGCSYIALGLAAFLAKKHYTVVYEEHDGTGHAMEWAGSLKQRVDSGGYFSYGPVQLRIGIPEGMELPQRKADIILEDFGSQVKRAAAEKPDFLLLVCFGNGARTKESYRALRCLGKSSYNVLYNFCRERRVRVPDFVPFQQCLEVPYIPDIWRLSREGEDFFRKLSKGVEQYVGKKVSPGGHGQGL